MYKAGLLILLFSLQAIGQTSLSLDCKNAGGKIKAVSSTCDFSCAYFEELQIARLEKRGLLCTRDAVETCVCPTGQCFENGACKPIPPRKLSKGPKTISEANRCVKAGGTWTQFSNGCMDDCSKVRNPSLMCTMSLSFGCDCGPDKCFEGSTCVKNP